MKALKDMTIGFANDHAGTELKFFLIKALEGKIKGFKNFGTDTNDSCDYPDFAHQLASSAEKGDCDFGIAICGTGNGISMSCNHHDGVRCGLSWRPEIAKLARAHNNANILGLPARFLSQDEALYIVEAFLSTEFEGGRHERRIAKIPVSK